MAEEIGGVRVVEREGRGRALVACRPLIGGEIVLKESSILLYSAFPLTTTTASPYCAHCFRSLSSSSQEQQSQQQQRQSSYSCPSCSQEVFCSLECYSVASKKSHTPWACQTLLRLRHSLSPHDPLDLHLQARFLVASYNLSLHSPDLFHSLLSLHGSSSDLSSAAHLLHPLLSPPPSSFSVDVSVALLAKDKLNAFGLMEPFSVDQGSNRSVRAYGIYPNASLFNHDCLPNACRFDYVDTVDTDITVRMIHDVPAGREICLSYFPVNLSYRMRQRRLLEDYGFACDCDRCKVEANWSDRDRDPEEEEEEEEEEGNVIMEEEEEKEGEEEVMEEDMAEAEEAERGDNSETEFPHAYFFVRYMCNRNNCGGTLAPLPPSLPSQSQLLRSPSSSSSDVVMECNVCGNLQTQLL
ncbi:hypothetical protein TIFTF001_018567 [Ficus carica]|uniref:SET domain-containing protein n=1 Tax=Ficus carica TaxID=3494 RepID=A0AA88D9D5_FICCA|nr:hypothetical protein TIFTF001_018567 [Ficus carica]